MKKSIDEVVERRPYTLTELARRFRMDRKTLKKWITAMEEELGPKVGRYYSARQVKIMIGNMHGIADFEDD